LTKVSASADINVCGFQRKHSFVISNSKVKKDNSGRFCLSVKGFRTTPLDEEGSGTADAVDAAGNRELLSNKADIQA
jgi:hypothetical protein